MIFLRKFADYIGFILRIVGLLSCLMIPKFRRVSVKPEQKRCTTCASH